MDAWWSQYSAGVSAEKEKVREHKDEDKQERKNMYALYASSILSTHGRVSVHAKLIRAGYSAIDFPFWNPEWDKTVTKHVNLTDKCTTAGSFPHAPTDRFHRLELENVPKAERND